MGLTGSPRQPHMLEVLCGRKILSLALMLWTLKALSFQEPKLISAYLFLVIFDCHLQFGQVMVLLWVKFFTVVISMVEDNL